MKFTGQNSFAISPHAMTWVGEKSKQGAQLLEAMEKLGKRATFEQLIKTNLGATSKLAFRLTGDWDATEELVQETMLRAVRNWDSFREQSQFERCKS